MPGIDLSETCWGRRIVSYCKCTDKGGAKTYEIRWLERDEFLAQLRVEPRYGAEIKLRRKAELCFLGIGGNLGRLLGQKGQVVCCLCKKYQYCNASWG